jgi:hypothetical protein
MVLEIVVTTYIVLEKVFLSTKGQFNVPTVMNKSNCSIPWHGGWVVKVIDSTLEKNKFLE